MHDSNEGDTIQVSEKDITFTMSTTTKETYLNYPIGQGYSAKETDGCSPQYYRRPRSEILRTEV